VSFVFRRHFLYHFGVPGFVGFGLFIVISCYLMAGIVLKSLTRCLIFFRTKR